MPKPKPRMSGHAKCRRHPHENLFGSGECRQIDYVPTPEEIAEAAAEIRAEWDEQEELRHRSGSAMPVPYVVPGTRDGQQVIIPHNEITSILGDTALPSDKEAESWQQRNNRNKVEEGHDGSPSRTPNYQADEEIEDLE